MKYVTLVAALVATAGSAYAQTANTVDVGTWNIEWFGHEEKGPADEEEQLERVRKTIADAGVELWGVQEVVDTVAFRRLLDKLEGYDGIIATDPHVSQGDKYYGEGEQKVGIIYSTDVVTVRQARLILTDKEHSFAGRPPLEVVVGLSQQHRLAIIVLHAKSPGKLYGNVNYEAWRRRRDGAKALKAYLDSERPAEPVLIVGDLNDQVTRQSVTLTRKDSRERRDSPYKEFVDDRESWSHVTRDVRDTVAGRALDHILVSDEAACWFVEGTAATVPVDRKASDHRPLMARFVLGRQCGP